MEYKYVSFGISDYFLGINVVLVREITPQVNFTRIPRAPDFVCGLMNLRGQIVTIIEPGIRLGIPPREISPKSRCIILKTLQEIEEKTNGINLTNETVNEPVGLLVDYIGEMVGTKEEDIESPPANIGEIDRKFMKGVLKLEDKLMIVLNTTEILKKPK